MARNQSDRKQITFEWVSDEDAYLDALTNPSVSPTNEHKTPYAAELHLFVVLLRRLIVLSAAFVLVASTAVPPDYWEWRRAWSGIQANIDAATVAWNAKDWDGYESLLDEEADKQWIEQLRGRWQWGHQEGGITDTVEVQAITLV